MFSCFFVFLWVTQATKSTKMAVDISERGRRNGTKFCTSLEGWLAYLITQTGDFWPRGSLRVAKILASNSIKFGMMGALGGRGLKRFW